MKITWAGFEQIQGNHTWRPCIYDAFSMEENDDGDDNDDNDAQ